MAVRSDKMDHLDAFENRADPKSASRPRCGYPVGGTRNWRPSRVCFGRMFSGWPALKAKRRAASTTRCETGRRGHQIPSDEAVRGQRYTLTKRCSLTASVITVQATSTLGGPTLSRLLISSITSSPMICSRRFSRSVIRRGLTSRMQSEPIGRLLLRSGTPA